MSFINKISPFRLAKALFYRAPQPVPLKAIPLSSLTSSIYPAYRKVGTGIPLLIGRSCEDDIDFHLSVQVGIAAARKISRRHLLLWWEISGWQVKDVSGRDTSIEKRNGETILLKGKGWRPIEQGEFIVFNEGAKIEFDLADDVVKEFRGLNRQSYPVIIMGQHLIEPRDGGNYFRLKDPSYLDYGMNIPGQNPREIIALRQDKETKEFLSQAKDRFFGIKAEYARAKKIYEYVRSCFEHTFDDTPKGWDVLATRYKNLKISLGYFLGIRSGCCRHQAAALILAYQEMGLHARYVRGQYKSDSRGRHAWVELEINGKWYIADPTLGIFGPKKMYAGYYIRGDNVVEVPIKGDSEPGANGTALYPRTQA